MPTYKTWITFNIEPEEEYGPDCATLTLKLREDTVQEAINSMHTIVRAFCPELKSDEWKTRIWGVPGLDDESHCEIWRSLNVECPNAAVQSITVIDKIEKADFDLQPEPDELSDRCVSKSERDKERSANTMEARF